MVGKKTLTALKERNAKENDRKMAGISRNVVLCFLFHTLLSNLVHTQEVFDFMFVEIVYSIAKFRTPKPVGKKTGGGRFVVGNINK